MMYILYIRHVFQGKKEIIVVAIVRGFATSTGLCCNKGFGADFITVSKGLNVRTFTKNHSFEYTLQ